MSKKKIISFILTLAIILTSIPVIQFQVGAKVNSPVLSSKKVVVMKGKKKTVKLKNATKKVRWKIVDGKKNVVIVKKTGKYNQKIKIKTKKRGNATIIAVHGKKIYILKVTIKDRTLLVPETTTKPEEETTSKQEETTTETESTTENIKIEYAKVTFLGLNKKRICSRRYPIGKTYGSLPELYVDGYLFLGWYVESSIGNSVRESDICEGDITLYAKFIMLGPTVEETYELVE